MKRIEAAPPAQGCFCCFMGKSRSARGPGNDVSSCRENKAKHEGIKTIRTCRSCVFSEDSDLCICLVTWNMNGRVSHEDLAELVGSKLEYDLLVMGLQEAPQGDIARILQTALAKTYVLLGKSVMQSVQLYIFGPMASESLIKDLKVDKEPVGGFGWLVRRKKGAVAIGIVYRGISMVFISCHLSAHAHNVGERNAECRHISHALFSKDRNPFPRPAQVTVWLGDLNYRLEGIGTYPARNLIQKQQHKMLIGKDQLLHEAERGKIFDGYCEGSLRFKPTYKYNIGSSDYDTSHKVRVPSWTDRILFRIEDANAIRPTLRCYESVDDIKSSDHKPVKAHLCLKVIRDP
ncbi:hypothetical protein MLD38_012932 [Melastoma candidum]|uniref:Uncharacterized protein n=1 Tax=Melastoma candidum TaxID=119954 RepID=A0ACB9R7K0_9MYRT|nr:hypothetical protein MLD38_012932 [Melastoma candidum]